MQTEVQATQDEPLMKNAQGGERASEYEMDRFIADEELAINDSIAMAGAVA